MTTFAQYVDDLAKRGIIDGNIADTLMARHRAEAGGNPYAAARKVIDETLTEMWAWPTTPGNIDANAVRLFANTIDDLLESAGGVK